jgi:hypothetical protein
MNSLNRHVTFKKITSRFGHISWKKILAIPKLKLDYERDRGECVELLKDIAVLDGFPFVTDSNKDEVRKILLPKLAKALGP